MCDDHHCFEAQSQIPTGHLSRVHVCMHKMYTIAASATVHCFTANICWRRGTTKFLYLKKWYKLKSTSRCFGDTYRKGKGSLDIHALPWRPVKALHGFGEVSLAVIITMSQVVLVKEILHHARFRGSHVAQVGYVFTLFFDGLH